MSETFLGAPRFKLTSCGGSDGSSFQVLDRAYCHGLLFETSQRRTAERIAGLLNAGNFETATMFANDLARKRAYDKDYHRRMGR